MAEYTGIVSMTREGFAFLTHARFVESFADAVDSPCDSNAGFDVGKKINGQEEEQDIFIAARDLRGALHGDRVIVAVHERRAREGKRVEGAVIHIIERSKQPYIGILQSGSRQAWVIIEAKNMPYDVQVPKEKTGGAKNGEKVAVVVRDWPPKALAPVGEIVEVLGKPGENDTEMHAILTQYGLPYRFSPKVTAEAEAVSEAFSEAEIARRVDFRPTCTFTIDPADAKDFDDALSVKEVSENRWEIGVHIADVSYYVPQGSIIDREAYERGTSVYLVDRTVPMLPEKLSNKLCSLRPGEDKYTFSAVFEMNEKAEILKTFLGRTLICSDYRFSYEQAQQILDGKTPRTDIPVPAAVSEALCRVHALALILRRRRFEAGAMAFERPEVKVIVDADGRPLDIVEKTETPANWLIEEFMLLANRAVAEFVGKPRTGSKPKTFVYRIHEAPAADKIETFNNFIRHIGYSLPKTDNVKAWAGAVNALLAQVKDKPEANAIEIMALRSMARAVYSTCNAGHYGLGLDYYTHFTSPIRRYPDLMVHRLLASYLAGGKSVKQEEYESKCRYASDREQLAVEAERASVKYKMAEFLQDKVGREFDATVSGLSEWGMYVELVDTHIEGMISLRDLADDYYVFDADRYCLAGRSGRRSYVLGQALKVRLKRVNMEQRLIDFELAAS